MMSTQEKWNKKLGKNRTKITKKKLKKITKITKKKTIKLNLPEKSNILSRSQARKKGEGLYSANTVLLITKVCHFKKNYVCPPNL